MAGQCSAHADVKKMHWPAHRMKCQSKIVHISVRLPIGRVITCWMNKCQAVRDLQEYVRSQFIGFDDMPADGFNATLMS